MRMYIHAHAHAPGRQDGKAAATTYADGTVYEGEWKAGKATGHGMTIWPDGSHCKGEHLEGLPHGPGVCTFPNGDVYHGGFSGGKWWGHGVLTSAADGSRFDGFWQESLQ